uniref:Uncharacterized protein n=1 Tax=Caenorhabditis japonica TaxID=281687 RepID=A0A8R1EM98_CAEJA
FKKKIANVPAFKTGFDFEVDKKDIEESLQKEWQIFSIELLRRGLLKIPDGFRIDLGNSPNSGEPLKVSKRKLLPIPENYLSPQKVAKVRVEKASPTKKKDQRKSSKLQKPAPSNAAPLPPDPPTPPPRIIHPADVGLCPPMYVQQYSVVRDFHEEVKRRKTDGSSMDDFRRVEERLFGKYAELESIRNIIAGMPKMKLTQDQKSVQAHFKKTWRQMEPEPLTEDVVESPEKPEKPDMPIKKVRENCDTVTVFAYLDNSNETGEEAPPPFATAARFFVLEVFKNWKKCAADLQIFMANKDICRLNFQKYANTITFTSNFTTKIGLFEYRSA